MASATNQQTGRLQFCWSNVNHSSFTSFPSYTKIIVSGTFAIAPFLCYLIRHWLFQKSVRTVSVVMEVACA